MDKKYNSLPSKKNALNSIIFLIKSKRESCYFNEPVFSIDVNKLSKEDLLIYLSLHFDTKIVISYERYERYDCYLSDKIMNDCFTVGFESNTFFMCLKILSLE